MNATEPAVMPDFVNRRAPFHYSTALNTLAKLGVDLSTVDIFAAGEFENYKGEIREQDPAAGTAVGPTTKITLKIGFPSAIDNMPYQFFYGLRGVTSSTGAWEDAARNMMAPFDAAVVRHYAAAKLHDLESNLGLAEFGHLRRFLKLFDYSLEDQTENITEAVVWASVFPTFNQWSGSPVLVCRVLQALFGYDFRIRENVEMTHEIPESCRSKLGNGGDRLGSGFILGGSFSDYDSGYEVVISGVSVDDVPDLLPHGKKRKRLEQALSIFMPNDMAYKIRVKSPRAKIAIGEEEHKNYLGYTSYMGT
jgi:hypothetical protein